MASQTLVASRPTLLYEDDLRRSGFNAIAGIDEAGRGSLAGPVVAAAVVLPDHLSDQAREIINDSKKLSAARREKAFDIVIGVAVSVGVGHCSAEEVDRIGIVPATKAAMRRAIHSNERRPDFLLIDAVRNIGDATPCEAIIRGDSISYSIASASIVAKVTRDRMMTTESDRDYPEYGFADHKGYGTARHLQALQDHGPSPIHRRTFRPVSGIIAEASWRAIGKANSAHIAAHGTLHLANGIGKTGEAAAARYLTSSGYKILRRNYRTRAGEVDIIAEDDGVLVFAEVKTRKGSVFGQPSEGFTLQKFTNMRNAALTYLAVEHGTDSIDWRIDFVGVEVSGRGTVTDIELIKNAQVE